MLVVSDATPVNTLLQIGQIDLLVALFTSVVVPTSVAEEMSRSATPEIVKTWVAHPPAWFTVRTPSSPTDPTQLRHRGERDAIILAGELHADAILLDEEKPRAQAIALGLNVIGTIGILERAADLGLIADLKAVHDTLRQTKFHATNKLLEASLARHLSRKRS